MIGQRCVLLFVLAFCLGIISVSAWADDDAREIAHKILETVMGDNAQKKAGDVLISATTPLVLRDNPGKEQAVATAMQKTVAPIMADGFDAMRRQMEDNYVKTFSVDELNEILAFDTSAVGQKYKNFNVEMMTKMKDTVKNNSAVKSNEAMRALAVYLKTNGLNVPKELDR